MAARDEAVRTTKVLSSLRARELAAAARTCKAWHAVAAPALEATPLLRARPHWDWDVESDAGLAWLRDVPREMLNRRHAGETPLMHILRDYALERLAGAVNDEGYGDHGLRCALALLDVPGVDPDAAFHASEANSCVDWQQHTFSHGDRTKLSVITCDGLAPVHIVPWLVACARGYSHYLGEPEELREALQRRGACFDARDCHGRTLVELQPIATQRVYDMHEYPICKTGPKHSYRPEPTDDEYEQITADDEGVRRRVEALVVEQSP